MCITKITSITNIKRKFFAITFAVVMLLCMTSCSDTDSGVSVVPPDKPDVTEPIDPPDVIDPNDPPLLPPVWIAVATTASDYSTSNFEIMLREDYTIISSDKISGLGALHALSGDIAIRSFLGEIYILESFGRDNVIKITGDPQIMYQQSLGEGINLHDIAVVSQNKAYVSALQDHNLIVFDPQAGSVLSTIDMSRFNAFVGMENEAPYPYVASLAYYDNNLYAACQRLDPNTWGIGDVSVIAIIDTRDNEISGSIELAKRNPASMSMLGSRMLVSSSGSWSFGEIGGEYAGIEIIDIDENENLGVIIDGSELGGNPSDIIFVAYDKAYVVVMGNDFTSFVVAFDPTTGTVGARIDGIGDASGGLAFDGEKLYVGDRDLENFGVAVVDIVSDEVQLTIPTNMPPISLAVVR